MLKITGQGKSHTCDGVTRRDVLQVGALGAVGLTLPQYMAAEANGAIKDKDDDRACIMIFNLGAPSHVDTFDMKPDAPAEVRGPFKPIKTASPEIQISEILPQHAKVADKFSLVRSCYHTSAAVHDAGAKPHRDPAKYSDIVYRPQHHRCATGRRRERRAWWSPPVYDRVQDL